MDSDRKIAAEFRVVFMVKCRNVLVGEENRINFVYRDDRANSKGCISEIGSHWLNKATKAVNWMKLGPKECFR